MRNLHVVSKEIQETTGLYNVSQQKIYSICAAYRDMILDELLNAGDVSISGIGRLYARPLKERIVFGRKVNAHYTIRFKACKNLKNAINELHDVD